jgi:hypothetical protein
MIKRLKTIKIFFFIVFINNIQILICALCTVHNGLKKGTRTSAHQVMAFSGIAMQQYNLFGFMKC